MNVELIAHRGFSAIAPENTLSAFLAAVEQGANAIECDLQLSADGHLVLMHDATLDRTTDGTGNVRDFSLNQLKQLDAGIWFSDRFVGERIPTLAETFDLLQDRAITLYLEIKQAEDWTESDMVHFVKFIRDRHWLEKCAIASFSDDFLDRLRQHCPYLTLAYYPLTASDYLEKVRQLKSDNHAILLSEYHLLLDNPDLIAASQNQNLPVGAWTVDRHDDLEQLVSLGVTKIITNDLVNI
ncbi:MAG: glycerophosphodiester phosphodiesterase family protein [Jaaginema sp. PMC 1079.18]|nr:glycerophosphodiester phosphodiesterase family protein [Jaaginema sp. PMC 1080.18]MEC4850574.1 glycerophosphodiester phosphodiesterase family protein [Jaaginema sp. PMC 1079.18]MEC4866689.1 glycerophosphodiester phosphodiesterase family protein [Jaaginema sp. PMC 1078.18]